MKQCTLSLFLLQLVAASILLGPAAASTYGSWHECSAQAVYGGWYGAELLTNLTSFKSNLLSHVWSSFDPTVPYPEVCQAVERQSLQRRRVCMCAPLLACFIKCMQHTVYGASKQVLRGMLPCL